MPKKSLFLISFVMLIGPASMSYGADTSKPHPISPQTWRFFPAPAGPTSITMQASRCYDIGDPNTPPVWYYYQCTTTGHTDINSGWIQGDSNAAYDANTIWTVTGLDPNTSYSFKYRARDSADPCNMTNWSGAKSAKTDKATTPALLRLDFNAETDSNAINNRPGFTPFTLSDNGSTIGGITVDLAAHIDEKRNPDPCGQWFSMLGDANQEYYQRAGETLYQDMIFGISPNGIKVTLWGLGVNQDCNLTLFAYDDKSTSEGNRVAHWFSNGTPIFDTNFIGGQSTSLRNENDYPNDIYKWAYSKRVTADAFGRIVLTSTRGSGSPETQPFSFINALVVEPNALTPFVPTKYAYHPVPVDDTNNAPVDVTLEWKQGGYAEKHDVYFGTDGAKVNDANRSNSLGVLVSENQSTTTYTPPEFLDLNTTYYWRIDEVNSAPDYTIFKGEVWSFTTSPYFVVEDFDSYADDAALQNVWQNNNTSAEVSVETAIARGGQSMKYRYKNNLPPYYSEVYADIADLGMDDPDWPSIGAKTLVLYFYGEPTNPLGEQMYVKLTDGDSPAHTATVTYGNVNDVRLKQWNKWSIALTEFTDVNLANVKRITIGFGDGSHGNAGAVYFEDILLDIAEVEELSAVTGTVNVNTIYQQLEGFGAAAGWHEFEIPGLQQPYRDSLYDTAFKELGLDIYRIRNTYQYDDDYMNNTAQIVAAAKQRNPSLKILISAWSPAAYLKSNGIINGGGNATLAKDANDPNNSPPYYVYKKYAKWWYDSLVAWDNNGVTADYVCMQNEPDVDVDYDSCRFNATESSSVAGYNKAFEAVYQEFYSQMGSNMPKMLPPETGGFYGLNTYIDNLINRSHAYGYAHHIYNGGGSYDYPDGFISQMTYYHNNYGGKPLMMTEFSKLGQYEDGDVTAFHEAINLAQTIHNAMVFEYVSAYIYWELFWTSPRGLIMYGNTYAIPNPVYYAFKQYSAFTDPGWYRIGASTNLGSQGNVRISAFKSPDNQQLSIVIINLAYNDVNLTLNLNGFPMDNSAIYRTSETENTTYIGSFYGAGSLMLPARSITTISNATLSISSGTLANCDSVLVTGHGLTSDISGDCYVNYKDLKAITDYWLNTECDLYGDCEGADFEPTDGVVNFLDLSTFAEQWLLCNNPEDPNCLPNW